MPVPESGDMYFLNEISLLLPKMGDGSCRWPYFFGKLDVDVQSLCVMWMSSLCVLGGMWGGGELETPNLPD